MNFLYILSCIYFFIPAYIANATPPLANTFNILNKLNKPIDGGHQFAGAPILGDHKTWRGLICEFIVCTLFTQLLIYINDYYRLDIYSNIGFNIHIINTWLLGLLLSTGIVFGDIFFAFVKRRLNLNPGAAFVPFDQTNYVIGAFIFLQPIIHLPLFSWLILFLLTLFVHILFNRVGYNLGLHKAKW
jgi:CDP-2,3-bis-(O-geranylgeranyl)-sn-glycerol synthase